MKFLPFSHFIVHGKSMYPTLKPGQEIISFNWAYLFSKPCIGDVVVFRKDGREIVKRVAKIKDKKFYVKGDNKRHSIDSRHFGALNSSSVIGKIIFAED